MIEPLDPAELAAARQRLGMTLEETPDEPVPPPIDSTQTIVPVHGAGPDEPEPAAEPATVQVFVPAPAAPVEPALSYTTPEARLLSEGWPCPVERLAWVIRSREALLAGVVRAKAIGAQDPARIANAARDCDADAVLAAIIANGTQRWLDANLGGAESHLTELHGKLLDELVQLLFTHQKLIAETLADHHSAAADAMWARLARNNGKIRPDSLGRTEMGVW